MEFFDTVLLYYPTSKIVLLGSAICHFRSILVIWYIGKPPGLPRVILADFPTALILLHWYDKNSDCRYDHTCLIFFHLRRCECSRGSKCTVNSKISPIPYFTLYVNNGILN